MSEKPVVVGVDGSPCSRVALEYALDEAARRGAPLVAVSAVVLPEFWANSYGAFVPPPSDEEILDAVGKETREFVDDVVAAHGAVDAARVDVRVSGGHAGELLVAASQEAQLLVVGHRGRSAVSSVLLGSVGMHCVLHARCPVLVVRPGEDAPPS